MHVTIEECFVQMIRAEYPQAHIINLAGPMISGPEVNITQNLLQDIVNEMAAGGDNNTEVVVFPIIDPAMGFGCDGHPTAAKNLQMADQLQPIIAKVTGWNAATFNGAPAPIPNNSLESAPATGASATVSAAGRRLLKG